MREVFNKIVLGVKIVIFSIVLLFALVVFSPMIFTDKETYSAVKILASSYDGLYTGGRGLEYAIVIQCSLDTADDFINSYQNENIVRSKQYEIENKAINTWQSLNYNGKDKTLRNVSNIMVTFSYAPAKASSDLKMLLNSKILKGWINVKAIMYNIRFDEPVIYIIFRLLALLAVVGTIYVFTISDDIREDEYWYEDEDEDDEYGEDDEFKDEDDLSDSNGEQKKLSNKEQFEESIRQRRVRMR